MQVKNLVKVLFCSGLVIAGFSLYEAGIDRWFWGVGSATIMAALLLVSDPDEYITIPENMNVHVFRAINGILCVGSAIAAIFFELFTILGVSLGFLAIAVYPSYKVEKQE